MKHTFKKLFALLLCVSLCVTAVLPITAANTLDVTFTAVIDTPTIAPSDQPQTVVVNILVDKQIAIDSMGADAKQPEGFSVAFSNSENSTISYTVNGPKAGWFSPTGENVTLNSVFMTLTYTVPANVEPGTYELGVTGVNSSYLDELYDSHMWVDGDSVTTTLTVAGGEPVPPPGPVEPTDAPVITTDVNTVYANENVVITVKPNTAYAATKMTFSYNSEYLTYVSTTLDGESVEENTDTPNTLIIKRIGEELTAEDTFTITFKAKKNTGSGATTVALTEAKFSTKADAVDADLEPKTPAEDFDEVAFTIQKAGYDVFYPEYFTGLDEIGLDATEYTFSVKGEYKHYNFGTVSATVGGTAVEVNGDATTGYTIQGPFNGNIVITCAAPTPKTFTVTFVQGGDAADWVGFTGDLKPKTATYGTTFTYTIPTDNFSEIDATVSSGVVFDKTNGVITVAGTDVIANFTITLTRKLGDISVAVPEYDNWVKDEIKTPAIVPGQDYKFTVTKDALYNYEIIVTDKEDNTVTYTEDNGTYTIAAEDVIPGTFTIKVKKTLVTEGLFDVVDYVQLDNAKAYLVLMGTADDKALDGRLYTYDGADMFWSSKYNAYATVVIAENKEGLTADKLALKDGNATDVDYSGNVNCSNVIDANDAQLIYNIYSATYNAFDEKITVEKFLRADFDGDGKVDINDAKGVLAQ